MKLIKQSQLSGKTNAMELNITDKQLARYTNGELVQNVFPDMSLDEMEFIISGITPDEWLSTFGNEED